MATWESRVLCEETYVSGGAENYSNVKITFQIRRMDYPMVGYNNAGTAYWSISCDGQNTGNRSFTFNWGSNPAGSWWTVGSETFRIAHNSDGSKVIGFSAYYYTAVNPSSFSASGSATLTKIGRYPVITKFNITSVTQTSVTVDWWADSQCDIIQYSLNNGGWVTTGGVTFTVGGLAPGTSYTIKLNARRKDSQLWTSTGNASFTTPPIATISNSLSFNIGGFLYITFNNYNNNASFLRLYQKNTSGAWALITSASNVKQSSYSWNLSAVASAMYANTPRSNRSEIRVDCGVSLNGTEYKNSYYGTATVVNSNPTFSDFSFANTDTVSHTLFGHTRAFITYQGKLKVDITTKAVAKNSATISYYNVQTTIGSTAVTKRVNESTSAISVEFDPFSTNGAYKVSVQAVDSRGNASGTVSKSFNVYSYHAPTATISLDRLNKFEKETSLTISAAISRVLVSNTTNYNSLVSLKYRSREAGGIWSGYTTITPTTANSGNDIKITFSKSLFATLETNIAYDYEFVIQDKVKTVTFSVPVGQGAPIMLLLDNGKVLIGSSPTDDILAKTSNLIVSTDILAKDTDGQSRDVFGQMRRLIVESTSEPSNQVVGGLWLKVE